LILSGLVLFIVNVLVISNNKTPLQSYSIVSAAMIFLGFSLYTYFVDKQQKVIFAVIKYIVIVPMGLYFALLYLSKAVEQIEIHPLGHILGSISMVLTIYIIVKLLISVVKAVSKVFNSLGKQSLYFGKVIASITSILVMLTALIALISNGLNIIKN